MTEKNGKPRLIPQSHGGALLSGGIPGHKGGAGRPPSELRERLRGTVEQRIPILEQILDDRETSTPDKLRALDLLLRYSIGAPREISGIDGAPIVILAAEAEKAREMVRKKLQALRTVRSEPDPKNVSPLLP